MSERACKVRIIQVLVSRWSVPAAALPGIVGLLRYGPYVHVVLLYVDFAVGETSDLHADALNAPTAPLTHSHTRTRLTKTIHNSHHVDWISIHRSQSQTQSASSTQQSHRSQVRTHTAQGRHDPRRMPHQSQSCLERLGTHDATLGGLCHEHDARRLTLGRIRMQLEAHARS